MYHWWKRFAVLTPALAVFAGGPASAGGGEEPQRAVTLGVSETEDQVAVELIANSPTAQSLEYEIELVGNSRSRHKGSTSIPANTRHVLSTMKTSAADGWCATVKVTEQAGESYTLTAGSCQAA
jgi:hypothetical protein